MTRGVVAGGGGLVADQRDVTRRLLGERGEREDQYLPLVRRDDVDGERARCDRLDPADAGSVMSTVTIESRAMSGGLGRVMPRRP